MKTDTLPALVATLHGLAHLKELSLFMKVETDAPMDIEDLFFVFSRLDKLSVGGTWIANERQQYQENIEPGTGAGGELQESPQSWKVKELMPVSATAGSEPSALACYGDFFRHGDLSTSIRDDQVSVALID
ncbi:hypothetical protein BGW39_001697 [Mortierella sp. 14UC]|nr:hypothetical protein BGW39_001697 [Mortierella sp. 14UC]